MALPMFMDGAALRLSDVLVELKIDADGVPNSTKIMQMHRNRLVNWFSLSRLFFNLLVSET